jgi:hypothetical protein
MPLILRCDTPDCKKETRAVVTARGVGGGSDSGWWYVTSEQNAVCACSIEHFAIAMQYVPALDKIDA